MAGGVADVPRCLPAFPQTRFRLDFTRTKPGALAYSRDRIRRPPHPPPDHPKVGGLRQGRPANANTEQRSLELRMTTAVESTEQEAAAVSNEVVIETQNLTKVYRDFWGRKKVSALKALDLEVRRGEIFGLLGPNGSGKSTTMKLLLGLLFPTGGKALVFDREATDVANKERIGYLPEESYLYKFLNAEETLDFYGRLFDIPAAERRERIGDLINEVGLGWAKRRQLKEYSKGMTRRIGLAQALINDPELILLDEPTTGLDPIGTREMKDMILNLRERGKTVVMCSHLLADVQDVCDRIAILHQGELKEQGRVDDLLKVRGTTQVQAEGLTEDGEREVRELIERLGGKVLSIKNPTSTLEELFLEIVDAGGDEGERRGGFGTGLKEISKQATR